jgi:hypothetical protein
MNRNDKEVILHLINQNASTIAEKEVILRQRENNQINFITSNWTKRHNQLRDEAVQLLKDILPRIYSDEIITKTKAFIEKYDPKMKEDIYTGC